MEYFLIDTCVTYVICPGHLEGIVYATVGAYPLVLSLVSSPNPWQQEYFETSPVAADDRIFLVAEEGTVYIIRAGRKYELLHKIPLGETSLVTPGIVDGMIIFRTAGRLIAVKG